MSKPAAEVKQSMIQKIVEQFKTDVHTAEKFVLSLEKAFQSHAEKLKIDIEGHFLHVAEHWVQDAMDKAVANA